MYKHWLVELRDWLDEKGLRYVGYQTGLVAKRKAGKIFTKQEHVKGLIYALLSSRTKWIKIEQNLPQIDKLFFDYNAERIKETTATYFYDGLKSLGCNSQTRKAEMAALHYDIDLLEQIEKKFGTLDGFVTSNKPEVIVEMISNDNSLYKLRRIGPALAYEYLRNVGVDCAKPDVHMCRFLGTDRMGKNCGAVASIDDVVRQVRELSDESGLTKYEIDNIIWSFCAVGYGEICTENNPKCSTCPLVGQCRKIIVKDDKKMDVVNVSNSENNDVLQKSKRIFENGKSNRDFDSPLDKALIMFCEQYTGQNGYDRIVTTSEIKDWCRRNYGTNDGSIIPTDYCYNRTNNGLNKVGTVQRPMLFEYVERGKFRCLGLDYPYSGDMFARPKGSKEDVVVGHWEQGKFYEKC